MKQIRYWGPAVAWMLVIFFFSTRSRISVSPEELWNFIFFKSLHILEYAMLYILVYRALKNIYIRGSSADWALWAFVIVISYAMTDELHQIFVVSREGRARDVIIDTIGATLAWISLERLLPAMPRKLRSLAKHWLAL